MYGPSTNLGGFPSFRAWITGKRTSAVRDRKDKSDQSPTRWALAWCGRRLIDAKVSRSPSGTQEVALGVAVRAVIVSEHPWISATLSI